MKGYEWKLKGNEWNMKENKCNMQGNECKIGRKGTEGFLCQGPFIKQFKMLQIEYIWRPALLVV